MPDSLGSGADSGLRRFALSGRPLQRFELLGMSDLVLLLCSAYDHAYELEVPLRACVRFEFLHVDTFGELRQRDTKLSNRQFWGEVSQLLILANRSAPRAIQQLIDGLLVGCADLNGLVLALSLRALIEQASSLHFLSSNLARHRDRLVTVWNCPLRDAPDPQDDDRELGGVLRRYTLGQRIRVGISELPSASAPRAEWDRYSDAAKLIDEDEVLRARQLLKDIDFVSKGEARHYWRPIYEYLCEYCHPNSASRLLDFDVVLTQAGRRDVHQSEPAEIPPGFQRLLRFSRDIIPLACELIEVAFRELGATRKPLEPLFAEAYTGIPRSGAHFAQDEFGRTFWIDGRSLDWESPYSAAQLSESQRQRNEVVWRVFSEWLPHREEWERSLAMDLEPEEELQLWERLAGIYQQELSERSNFPESGRRLLFIAIIKSAEIRTVEELVSGCPELKALRKIDRVFRRVKTRQR